MGDITAEFFKTMDKYLKYLIYLLGIAILGTAGSLLETYVKTNGLLELWGWVGAGIIIVCVFYFWASVLGKFFEFIIIHLK
jgi:hypothetical protein